MKHDDRKTRFGTQRSVETGSLTAKAGPGLREFWAELLRAKAAGTPLPAASGSAVGGMARNAPAACSAGSFRSSGSGSGSGGAGYGLALISSDPVSQERIRRIMQSLCEKDAKRGQ